MLSGQKERFDFQVARNGGIAASIDGAFLTGVP